MSEAVQIFFRWDDLAALGAWAEQGERAHYEPEDEAEWERYRAWMRDEGEVDAWFLSDLMVFQKHEGSDPGVPGSDGGLVLWGTIFGRGGMDILGAMGSIGMLDRMFQTDPNLRVHVWQSFEGEPVTATVISRGSTEAPPERAAWQKELDDGFGDYVEPGPKLPEGVGLVSHELPICWDPFSESTTDWSRTLPSGARPAEVAGGDAERGVARNARRRGPKMLGAHRCGTARGRLCAI